MKGTEKQIKWAEKIKKEHIEYLSELIETVKGNTIKEAVAWVVENGVETATEFEESNIYKSQEKFEQSIELAKKIKEALEKEESAKFIIENREDLLREIAHKNNIKYAISRLRNAFNKIKEGRAEIIG